jgi:hypothetical protein
MARTENDNFGFRWIVVATYKSDHGDIDVDWHMEELDELAEFIERGPDWNALIEMKIILNPKRRSYDDTVEQAEQR